MTTFPRAYGSGKGGNGREYKTASGEFTKDEGGVSVRARDEHNEMRKITGRIADIHKPLVSPSQCAEAGQRTSLDDSGGWMFSKDSIGGKQVSRIRDRESKRPQHGMMPIYEAKGVYIFYVKLGQSGSIGLL